MRCSPEIHVTELEAGAAPSEPFSNNRVVPHQGVVAVILDMELDLPLLTMSLFLQGRLKILVAPLGLFLSLRGGRC